jgi:hypothetical protein
MWRKSFLSGCAALVLGVLAVGSAAVAGDVTPGGDGGQYVTVIGNDGSHATINIDWDANAFGTSHDGTITFSGGHRPVRIVREVPRPGNGGSLHGRVNGNIYTWSGSTGGLFPTKGVHYTIELEY